VLILGAYLIIGGDFTILRVKVLLRVVLVDRRVWCNVGRLALCESEHARETGGQLGAGAVYGSIGRMKFENCKERMMNLRQRGQGFNTRVSDVVNR
jgi:hypothetical protein